MTPDPIPVRSEASLECRHCGAGAPVDEHFCRQCNRIDTAWDLTTSLRLGCQAVIRGEVVAEFPMYTRNYVQEGGAIQLGQPEADKGAEVRS